MVSELTSKSSESYANPLTPNALTLLKKRYLQPNETIDSLWDRVSGGNTAYRRLLSSLHFLPNSPTLFNAGTNNGCTLSACFVLVPEDKMLGKDSITDVRTKAVAIARAGGGVGYYFGNIRPKGSLIKSVHRKACGPVAVLRDYHHVSSLITQGGKRELAQMGILNSDHTDIEEFIHCKNHDPQGLGSFNISVSWKDEDIQEVDQVNKSKNKNTELWWKQCKAAWSHGCPGMFFYDHMNKNNINPHLGYFLSTNPCGEVPLRNGEPCNLGSLSLPHYYNSYTRTVNYDLLCEDAYTATRFLDDILDWNVFPHPDIEEAALRTRKLGLGVMGWADLLALLHIHYDTEEALVIGENIASWIRDSADRASRDLAKEKGVYPGFSETRSSGPRQRNETVMSIAPTGTIAIIAGVWGSIEPHFAIRCERTTAEGIKLQDGIQDWVWNQLDGFVPKTADQIAPEWHVRHQAAFQKYTDLSVSKTINLPNSATVEDVSRIYKMMYDYNCKGGTIFRDHCRDEQVLVKQEKTKSVYLLNGSEKRLETMDSKSIDKTNQAVGTLKHIEYEESLKLREKVAADYSKSINRGKSIIQTDTSKIQENIRRELPNRRQSITHKFRVGDMTGFLTVGMYEDGTPGEIFLRASKIGSSISGLLDTWAITFSVALQNGVSLETLCKHHTGTRFEPAGMTECKEIPVATSIPDYVCRWLLGQFNPQGKELNNSPSKPIKSGQLCPDCGEQCVYIGGCISCPTAGCGWTRCG